MSFFVYVCVGSFNHFALYAKLLALIMLSWQVPFKCASLFSFRHWPEPQNKSQTNKAKDKQLAKGYRGVGGVYCQDIIPNRRQLDKLMANNEVPSPDRQTSSTARSNLPRLRARKIGLKACA